MSRHDPDLATNRALVPQALPGWRSTDVAATLAKRDRLLGEAAARFVPGLSRRAQAAELHRRWTHYAGTGWERRRERTLAAPPVSREGTLQGLLWAALKARHDVIGEERIRRILGRKLGVEITHASADLDLEG